SGAPVADRPDGGISYWRSRSAPAGPPPRGRAATTAGSCGRTTRRRTHLLLHRRVTFELTDRMGKTRIVILGGGPAGLGAAYQLARRGDVEAVLLEQSDRLGGNAGSFELAGIRCDYGSHRLHPASDPRVLDDIRRLLGDDLV